jgi:2-keto-4-pentenoate hydratase/2-oxohepta-3-ene-1,7-dioic acid hydratase in catechol pathway
LLAPIRRPPKILALGRNYLEHARESGHEAPPEPIVFCKASSSVIGPEEPVACKKSLGRVDPEIELAVVIGKEGSDIPAEQASDYVAGYTILNDVSARDVQSADLKASNPWLRSKSIDTFCPMGPCVLLADEAPEPVSLDMELRVNGEVRQRDNTANLIFKIPQVIEFISRHMTLEPGDIISTGTPAGIQAIFPGDVMECWVEKIGILRNPVVG